MLVLPATTFMLSINALDLCRWESADKTIYLQSVIMPLYCPGLLASQGN